MRYISHHANGLVPPPLPWRRPVRMPRGLRPPPPARPVENDQITLRDEDDEITLRDVELAETHARLDAALNNMAHGLLMIDGDLRVVLRNRQMLALFGLDPDIVRPGASMEQVIAHSVERGNHPGRTSEQVAQEMARLAAAGVRVAFEQSLPDGRLLSVHWEPMLEGGWVCTYEDITARVRAAAQVAHLACHDPVTGLPNRFALHEAMRKAMRAQAAGDARPLPKRGKRGFNLLCLEIDRFRMICDTRGHRAGDLLLAHVGRVLASCVRDGDLVAHLGGASFAILQITSGAVPAAMRVAARALDAVRNPMSIEGRMIMATVSMGVAVATGETIERNADDEQTLAEEMLRNATLALHRAVADGGGLVEVYAPDMDRTAQARHALELDLRAALDAGQFELHYQPLVCARRRRVTGFEALLRWRHPERGLVSPATFIPLAEELGLIGAIGAWALRSACHEAAGWAGDVRVAVNLSPLQFGVANTPVGAGTTPDLASLVAGILAETALPANRLELEITESVRLQDSDETLAMLHALRATGVRVALDDFGTGYSSLSYLRCFPFDKLKIDQSFVRGLPAADSMAIVRAVLALGHSLGMTIVAEGVEIPAQLDLLAAEGCHEMQGYLFSRPVPAGAVRGLLGSTLWPVPSEPQAATESR